jgi:hypothetical protein
MQEEMFSCVHEPPQQQHQHQQEKDLSHLPLRQYPPMPPTSGAVACADF